MNNRLIPKFSNKQARETFWLRVCQEFISSGLGKAEFCVKRKVSDSSLYRWLDHFKGALEPSQPKQPIKVAVTSLRKPVAADFLPIKVTSEKQASQRPDDLVKPPSASQQRISGTLAANAELIFPNGLRLMLSGPPDADLLSKLMQLTG